MKVRMKAPEGYKYHDTNTDKDYSEVVIEEKERDRYVLVPSSNFTIEVTSY